MAKTKKKRTRKPEAPASGWVDHGLVDNYVATIAACRNIIEGSTNVRLSTRDRADNLMRTCLERLEQILL